MKAVDIVIVPPDHIKDKIIEINHKSTQKYVMSKDDFVPHISLAIGITEEQDLALVYDKVKAIANTTQQFSISLSELYYFLSSTDGKKSYSLRADVTKEIQNLHETVMHQIAPYFSDAEATEDMIFGDIDKMGKTFTNFSEKYSFSNFDPHITLLAHQVPDVSLPIEFTAGKIAIYQLGKSCTCRNLLYQTNLKK